MNRIEEIESLLTAADLAYFNTGEAIMEDAQYDALRAELRKLAPNNKALKRIGAAAGMLEKRTHTIPMGSLDKAMNKEEWLDWVGKMAKAGHTRFTASLKMDGGSVSLEYKAGRLVQAVTRGDGFVGEDITANALRFKNLPKEVKLGGKPFTGFVRAEIMLLNDDWLAADPDQLSNPRNLGNGISRRKDGEESELLTVYAFRAHFADGKEIGATEWSMLASLQAMGFTTVTCATGGSEGIWEYYEKMAVKRSGLSYWIDGIVVKVDDIAAQKELGESGQCPRGQIAIKFPAVGVETELLDVELTVGHTGAVIPVGKLKPCQIGGVTVSSVLLCNWTIIDVLGVAVGDTVLVTRQGDVIPKVQKVVYKGANRKLIARPTKCPVCSGPVGHKTNTGGDESAALFCLNDDCSAKVIGKIERYIKSLNILGIGDEVLVALVEQLNLETAADLYLLKNHVDEMAEIVLGGGGRLGESRAAKIVAEIEKVRELTLPEFLGSIGIEGLGKRRVALIQAAVPGQMDTLADWLTGKLESLAEQAGVPNTGARMSRDLIAATPFICSFEIHLKAAIPSKPVSANCKTFCMTGALSRPRDEYVKMIEAAGHVFKDSVSKGLDYLVIADPESTSSKAVKARKLGTKCIGEEELIRLLS